MNRAERKRWKEIRRRELKLSIRFTFSYLENGVEKEGTGSFCNYPVNWKTLDWESKKNWWKKFIVGQCLMPATAELTGVVIDASRC